MMGNDEDNAAFGFRKVAESGKQGLVNEVFSKVAGATTR
jgi:hypothetical protein